MSDISKMLGGLLGGGGEKSNVLQSLLGMFTGGGGQGGGGFDLNAILGKFTGAGMSDKAQSWVGTGENAKVSGAEVEQALGKDTVTKVAEQAGIPADKAAEDLAETLPQLVDKVTPEGKMPDTSDLQGMLSKFLGK